MKVLSAIAIAWTFLVLMTGSALADGTASGSSKVATASLKPGTVIPNSPIQGGGGPVINCSMAQNVNWVDKYIFTGAFMFSSVNISVNQNCDQSMAMSVAFQTTTPQGQLASGFTDGNGMVCGPVVNACADGRSQITTVIGRWQTGFVNVYYLTQAQLAAGYSWSSWSPACSPNGSELLCITTLNWILP